MKTLQEVLFWAHVALIVLAILSGLFLPLWLVVALAILHRAHVWFFKGCLFTWAQKHLGGLPQGHSFLQYAVSRFSGRQITERQAHALDVTFVVIFLVIAFAKFIFSG